MQIWLGMTAILITTEFSTILNDFADDFAIIRDLRLRIAQWQSDKAQSRMAMDLMPSAADKI